MGLIKTYLSNNIINIVSLIIIYFELPENESWRLPVIFDLLNTRRNLMEITGFNVQEVEDLLKHVCTT